MNESTTERSNNTLGRRILGWILGRVWNATALVICILIGTTLLSMLAQMHWLADLMANLRVQQVIAILIAVVITICFRRWRWLTLQIVLLAIHVPWFASAFVGRPSDAGQDLVVLVANVLTSNRHHDLIVNQIETADADVVAILELGTPLARTLELKIAQSYPFRSALPQDQGNFGIGLYSKHPLKDVQQFDLNIPSIKSIAATVSKDGQSYRVVATHPLPPMGRQGAKNRNDHLQQLADRLANYHDQNLEIPMILVGDLNLTPWSPLFADFESVSGLRRAGRGYGMTPTWYARPNFAMGLMLDHGLISDDLDCVSHQIGDGIGSDHRSVRLGIAMRLGTRD